MKMATYKDLQVAIKVEAAGIEPASRDISMPASTCVVDYLVFRPRAPNRQGASQTSLKQF